MSVPARRGPWWYVTRTEEGKQYSDLLPPARAGRREGEQVLIDSNVLAAGHEYFELGALDVSPSHRLLAYSTDVDRQPRSTPSRIRDLDTGTDLPDTHRTAPNTARPGRPTTRYLFYTRPDDAMRPYQVWRHEVGTTPTDDVLVLPGGRRALRRRPRAARAAIGSSSIAAESRTTSEVRLLDATDAARRLRASSSRARQGIEYSVDHQGDRLLIVTNLDARRLPTRRSPDRRPGQGLVARPSRPPARRAADRRSTRSPITSSPTNGPTRCPACG